jgi:hypothetical protein
MVHKIQEKLVASVAHSCTSMLNMIAATFSSLTEGSLHNKSKFTHVPHILTTRTGKEHMHIVLFRTKTQNTVDSWQAINIFFFTLECIVFLVKIQFLYHSDVYFRILIVFVPSENTLPKVLLNRGVWKFVFLDLYIGDECALQVAPTISHFLNNHVDENINCNS